MDGEKLQVRQWLGKWAFFTGVILEAPKPKSLREPRNGSFWPTNMVNIVEINFGAELEENRFNTFITTTWIHS